MSLIEDCAGLAGAEPQTWGTGLMNNIVFVGLDVHKATIAVAVAEGARGGEVRELGNFLNHPDHIAKLVERLAKGGRSLSFCYEAGPCGYGLYRQLKDGTTHLAYKPEHAVDLDTGAIVAAPIHAADEGDVATLPATLKAAAENLADINLAPTRESPCELIADKGYHSRDGLKDLDDGVWKTRISEPKPTKGYLRWHGDEAARDAVYANRARLKSGVGRKAMRRRGELVERSFAYVLDRGGMRRAWLRGRENVHKRYLIHVAGFNLGLLMRAMFGAGAPRQASDANNALLFAYQADETFVFAIMAVVEGQWACWLTIIALEPN